MREDWIECSLIEGCDIHDNLRKPINSKDRNERINGKDGNQLYPYYGATGQIGYIDDYLTEGEYVLIGEDAAPFLDYSKDVAYPISGKTWVNNHAHILKSKFNDKFLLHYLNHFNYRDYVSGTTRLKLTQGKLKQIPIRVAPLPEQRAIVTKIEELFSDLDKGVADLKKAQDQLMIYRQAVLKKAFEGELTKEWREENNYSLNDFLKELKESKNSAIKEKLIAKGEYFPNYDTKSLTFNSPQNWLMLPWKTLCSNNKYAMKRGPFGSALKKAFFVEKGIVVYEQGHAINNEPFRHRYFISPEKFEELKAFETKAGDMIISCSGVTLGRICLLPDNADMGVINQALLKIDLDESIMLKNYFVQLFRSGTFQRLIFQKSLGSAMPNMVGMTELKEIPIPIPSIEEQHQILKEIESRLSVCDHLEESISESLDKAKALRQSILKKAFTGNLLSTQEIEKCKTEPDYEPAAVLLEKIKNL